MRFSKLLIYICKSNLCGRHQHMLKFTQENEFEIIFYHKSRNDWKPYFLSLCMEYDRLMDPKRLKNNNPKYYEQCRGRFRADLLKIEISGYIQKISTNTEDKSIKIQRYKILKMPTQEQLDECVLPDENDISYKEHASIPSNIYQSESSSTEQKGNFSSAILGEISKPMQNPIFFPFQNESHFTSETVYLEHSRISTNSIQTTVFDANFKAAKASQIVEKKKYNKKFSSQFEDLPQKAISNDESDLLGNSTIIKRKRKIIAEPVTCKYSRNGNDSNQKSVVYDLNGFSKILNNSEIIGDQYNYYETFMNFENVQNEETTEEYENIFVPDENFITESETSTPSKSNASTNYKNSKTKDDSLQHFETIDFDDLDTLFPSLLSDRKDVKKQSVHVETENSSNMKEFFSPMINQQRDEFSIPSSVAKNDILSDCVMNNSLMPISSREEDKETYQSPSRQSQIHSISTNCNEPYEEHRIYCLPSGYSKINDVDQNYTFASTERIPIDCDVNYEPFPLDDLYPSLMDIHPEAGKEDFGDLLQLENYF